jgi:hypothetical protein
MSPPPTRAFSLSRVSLSGLPSSRTSDRRDAAPYRSLHRANTATPTEEITLSDTRFAWLQDLWVTPPTTLRLSRPARRSPGSVANLAAENRVRLS